MRRHRRGERGQVVPVVALFLVILTGFLGVVVDGGIGYTHKRHDQDIADAAALAGAYSLYSGGTLAQAQSAANEVATLDACTGPCSLQALTWYDSTNTLLSGSPLTTLVARVGASVSDSETTTFAHIDPAGSRTLSVAASAQALVKSAGSGSGSSTVTVACELCLMGNLSVNAQTDTFATTNGDIDVNGNLTISAGLTTITPTLGHHLNVSGATYTINGPSVVTPTPQRTPPPAAITDPLAVLPTPTITGLTNKGTYNYPVGQAADTISPGIYNQINISGGSAVLNLNPGVYEITGGLSTTAGTVTINGTGVILYFGCNGPGTVPTCTSGQVGAGINISSQTVVFNLDAPLTGTDNGVVMFWDRNNSSSFQVAANSVAGTLIGAIYGLSMNVSLNAQNASAFAGISAPLIANNFTANANSLDMVMNGNALLNSTPASPGGLSQ